jgi:hypothetical protein
MVVILHLRKAIILLDSLTETEFLKHLLKVRKVFLVVGAVFFDFFVEGPSFNMLTIYGPVPS